MTMNFTNPYLALATPQQQTGARMGAPNLQALFARLAGHSGRNVTAPMAVPTAPTPPQSLMGSLMGGQNGQPRLFQRMVNAAKQNQTASQSQLAAPNPTTGGQGMVPNAAGVIVGTQTPGGGSVQIPNQNTVGSLQPPMIQPFTQAQDAGSGSGLFGWLKGIFGGGN